MIEASGGAGEADRSGVADLDGLERWLADERADALIARRRQTYWRQQRRDEAVRLAGVLRDACERGLRVVITTASGREHRGRIAGVGRDAVMVTTGAAMVLIRRAAVTALQVGRDVRLDGQRDVTPEGLDFTSALAALVESGRRLAVITDGGTAFTGEAVNVGEDVVVLRLDNRDLVYAAVHAISEVVATGSG